MRSRYRAIFTGNAAALGNDVSELSEMAVGRTPLALNSMCAVFADRSDRFAGLGHDKGGIVAGLTIQLWRMVGRLGSFDRVAFTGGEAETTACGSAWKVFWARMY